MRVMIEYIPISKIKTQKYPDVSENVFVNDNWTDEQIKEWYEEKHKNIDHQGIFVKLISHYYFDLPITNKSLKYVRPFLYETKESYPPYLDYPKY